MGKNIKRLSLALLALGLSAPVFADTCSPLNVSVPCQQGGFSFGGDALWLRPTAPNQTYNFVAGPVALTPTTFTLPISLNNVDPSYHWGFDLNAAYRFCGTGNDISVNWTHLGETSDSNSASQTIDFAPIGLAGVNLVLGATSTSKFKYDAVDLDVGQKVNFGDNFLFHMVAGVRWADLEQTKNTVYGQTLNVVTVPVLTNTLTLNQESEFKGVGPQVGFDGRYCIGYGFGFDAGAKASLLVGNVDHSANIADTLTIAPGTDDAAAFALSIPVNGSSKKRVVPALDANLGLDYTYNLNNCSRSSVVIQAGYKVVNYFDVSHMIISGGPNTAHNVAFDGPYAGIEVNI